MDMLNSSLGGFTGVCFFRQQRLSRILPRGGRLCTLCPPRRPFGGRRMGSGSGVIDFWRRQRLRCVSEPGVRRAGANRPETRIPDRIAETQLLRPRPRRSPRRGRTCSSGPPGCGRAGTRGDNGRAPESSIRCALSAGFASPVGTALEGVQLDDYHGFMSNERQSPPAMPAATALPAVVPGFLPSHPTLDRPTTLRLIWPAWARCGS